jgi:hypothetical protein
LKVILIKPALSFIDIPYKWGKKDVSHHASAEQAQEYSRVLLDAARTGVASKLRLKLLDVDKLDPPVVEVCKKLESLASRLARGSVNEEAIENLAQLAVIDDHLAVLVQFFRLETGRPATSAPLGDPRWGSPLGAPPITSSMDSTLIQAALVSGKTGKVLWKGERLVRYKALKPADDALSKTLSDLYEGVDSKY